MHLGLLGRDDGGMEAEVFVLVKGQLR
jgi:hypothetical protein